MDIIELKNGNVKLVADFDSIIKSKAMHFDEELNENVPDVKGSVVYLGKNDDVENYVEMEKEN